MRRDLFGFLDPRQVLAELREDRPDPERLLRGRGAIASSSRSPGMNFDTERRTNAVFVARSRSHAFVDMRAGALRAIDIFGAKALP